MEPIHVGKMFCIVQNSNGELLTSGKNDFGELGLGDFKKRKVLESIPNQFKDLISISCYHSNHVLFLQKDGRVFHTGRSHDLIGKKSITQKFSEITEIMFFKNTKTKIKVIYTTPFCSFFKTQEDKIFCCGSNSRGQLGRTETDDTSIKELNLSFLKPNEKIMDIKGGNYHTLILTTFGNVYSSGETETNRNNYLNSPKKFEFHIVEYFHQKGIKISRIEAGKYHSLFLSIEKKVYGWGKCDRFGLGESSELIKKDKFGFYLILHSKKILKIECGGYHSFFIAKENKKIQIYTLGLNVEYAMGLKDSSLEEQIKIPRKIEGYDTEFVDVYAGINFSLFVNKFGEIYSCGSNYGGQCCIGRFNRGVVLPRKIENIRIKVFEKIHDLELFKNRNKLLKFSNVILKTDS